MGNFCIAAQLVIRAAALPTHLVRLIGRILAPTHEAFAWEALRALPIIATVSADTLVMVTYIFSLVFRAVIERRALLSALALYVKESVVALRAYILILLFIMIAVLAI